MPELEDTTSDMKPGDLVKFVGYYEDWHTDENVWRYGVLVDRQNTDFSILWQHGMHIFTAEQWYIKKA